MAYFCSATVAGFYSAVDTPLEGMASGVPFVGSEAGYYRAFSAQEKSGMIVPLEAAEAAAEAARTILRDPARHAQMAQDARDIALHSFSARAEAEGIEAVYQALWSKG
jgi:mannosyltransferase